MVTIRPYNTEDTPENKAAADIAIRHCIKIHEDIEMLEIYGAEVIAITVSGRRFIVDCTENIRSNNANYFYLKERVNGKRVRIPKSNW